MSNPTTLPGDLSPDLLPNWSGPIEYLDPDADGEEIEADWYPGIINAIGMVWFEDADADWGPSGTDHPTIRLPLGDRRECRLRVADWLAAGLRCLGPAHAICGVDTADGPCDRAPGHNPEAAHQIGNTRPRCLDCNGTGYLRKPSPAWHLLDKSTALTEREAAELLTWSAVSVVRGGEPVAGVDIDGGPHLAKMLNRAWWKPEHYLAANYALRNPTGLVLPPLPEAPHVG